MSDDTPNSASNSWGRKPSETELSHIQALADRGKFTDLEIIRLLLAELDTRSHVLRIWQALYHSKDKVVTELMQEIQRLQIPSQDASPQDISQAGERIGDLIGSEIAELRARIERLEQQRLKLIVKNSGPAEARIDLHFYNPLNLIMPSNIEPIGEEQVCKIYINKE